MQYYKPHENQWIVLLAIALTSLSISTARADQAPSSSTPCKLHDVNNGPCLRDQWQNILINGFKDIPGVKFLSVDPYKVKKVRVSVDNPVIKLNMGLRKIVITGLAHSKVVDASVTNGELFTINMKIPKMRIVSDYALQGRVLVLNFDGKGPLVMDLADIVIGFIVKAKLVERDGEQFFDFTSVKSNVQHLGGLHVQFDNLFGENQALTESANELFNQNALELAELSRPVMEMALDNLLFAQAKAYLGNIPSRVAFSDVS